MPGQPDMSALLQQAQQMQQQLMQAQDELADARVEGTSGGGLVRVTAAGTGEVVDVAIEPEAVDPGDTQSLADLVLAAIRDAARAAAELQSRAMGPLAGGIGGLGDLGLGDLGDLGTLGNPGAGGGPALPGR
ncbi:MAG: nucleoid-associated protein EbfC [Actinomycetota bacterium]|jgi:DNA-binding YbaB/EbfC family protein|nr:nucleoid-associated protein EbfC [Actinomycetota bacterium]